MNLIVGLTLQGDWPRIQPLFEHRGATIADRQQLEEWGLAALERKEALPSGTDSAAPLDRDLKKSAGEILAHNARTIVLPVLNTRYLPAFTPWLNEFQNTYLLLLYSRPEEVLAAAMQERKDPLEVLHQWRQAAEQLMRVHRHNRSRSVLIDAQAALADPDSFYQVCSERFGLNGDSHQVKPSESTSIRDIYRLIAVQLTSQTAGMRELFEEMVASSLPMPSSTEHFDIDCMQACHDVQNLEDKSEHKLHDLEKENELLLLQLHQVQEELETYYLEHREEREKRESAEKAVKSRDDEIKQLSAALKQKNNEISQRDARIRQKDAKLTKKGKDYRKARQRIEMIRTSTSWRLTGPMRVFGRFLKRPFQKPKASKSKAVG